MTVAELITQLQNMPQDKEARIFIQSQLYDTKNGQPIVHKKEDVLDPINKVSCLKGFVVLESL